MVQVLVLYNSTGAVLITGIIQSVEAWPQLLGSFFFSAKLSPGLFKQKTKQRKKLKQNQSSLKLFNGKADGREILS